MATDTQKYASQLEQEPRHSALAEFSRDERRPAVLLLSALLLSALFFGLGLMVGRWTATPESTQKPATSAAPTTSPVQTPPQPAANTTNAAAAADASARRFALLVATFDDSEKAQPLIKALQEAGYTDIRTSRPRANETRPKYSVLVGRYTQEEAREAARRMRSAQDPRLKNARVIEDSGK